MANNETIGEVPCTLCGELVALKVTKKGKAYLSCGECGQQTFARGEAADSILKKRVKAAGGVAKPEQAAEVEPARPEPKEPPTVFDLLMGMGK